MYIIPLQYELCIRWNAFPLRQLKKTFKISVSSLASLCEQLSKACVQRDVDCATAC